LAKYGRDFIYLRIALDVGGACVSEDSVFLTQHRFVHLPENAKTKISVRMTGPARASVTFESTAFQHRFAFDLPGVEFQAGDNYFDLFPGEAKTVTLDFTRPQTAAKLKRLLTHRSLADSY
jgi:beta-mannosidase